MRSSRILGAPKHGEPAWAYRRAGVQKLFLEIFCPFVNLLKKPFEGIALTSGGLVADNIR